MKLKPQQRVAVIIAASLILIIAIVAVLLNTAPVKLFVLGKAREYFRRSQGIELDVASLDYDLFRLSVSLKQVSLKSSTAPDLPPILQIDRANVDLRWHQLVRAISRGLFALQDASLEGVAIQVVVDEHGRNNIPVMPQSPSPPPTQYVGPTYLISSLKVTDGSARFEDRRRDLELQLPLWQLEVVGNPASFEHHLRLRTGQLGRAVFEGRPLELRDLEIEGALQRAGLDLKRFKLETDGSRIEISGSLANFSKPELNANIDAEVDLAQFARLTGHKEDIEGKINGQALLTVSQNKIQLSGHMGGNRMKLARFEQIDFSTKSSWDSDSQIVRLESFSARSPLGSLHGQASLDLFRQKGRSSLVAQIKELDLERISRQLGFPLQLASSAQASINARWEGLEIARADGNASVQLVATRSRPAHSILPLSASLSLDSSHDRILLSISWAHIMGSSLQGQISIQTLKSLGGELRGDVASLADFMSNLQAFLGRPGDVPPLGINLDGPANLSARLGGTLDSPNLSASIQAPAMRVGQLQGVDLSANGVFDPNRILLEKGVVTWQGQSLFAQGDIGLKGQSPSLNMGVQVPQASVSAVMAMLNKQVPTSGTFQANAQLGGTLDTLEASATLSATDLMAYDEPLGNLSAEAHLTNRKLELTNLLLDKPLDDGEAGTLEAKAAYNFDSRAFDLQTEGSHLRFKTLTLPGDVPVRGELNLSARGTGTLENPSLQAKLDLNDLSVQNRDYGSIGATVDLAEQQAVIQARAPKFNIDSTAHLQTKSPYLGDVEFNASDTDLSLLDIRLGANQPLTGTLSATAKAQGALNEWKKGEASARISNLQLAVGEHVIHNQGPVEVAYAEGTVNVQPATLLSGNTNLQIEGTLPLESPNSPGRLRLEGHSDLGTVLAFAPAKHDYSASGELDLNVLLEGSLKSLIPSAEISLKDGSFSSAQLLTPLTDVNVNVSAKNDSLILNKATAQWASASIQANAEVPWWLMPANLPFGSKRKEGSARFMLDVKDLRPESIRKLPRDLSGILDLHVEAQAPRLDLSAVTGEATFGRLSLKLAEFEMEQSGTSAVSLHNGVAEVDQFTLTGPETLVQINGRGGLTGDRLLDLRMEGDLDAAILTFMLDEFKSTGDMRFQLALGGHLGDPRFSGFLELKHGQLSLATPRMLAENLEARLNFGQSQVSIEKFTGSLNGGSLNASGGVVYAGATLKDFNMDVGLDNVFLNYPLALKTASQAAIKIRSRENFIIIGGEVHILEGSYTDPLVIGGELLNFLRSEQEIDLAKERSPFLSRIRYDLSVDTQGPVLVDNNLAKVAVDANLKVVGTYYRPALTGRLELEEGGEIYLSEKKYYIERGAITFINENKIEPSLDIEAKTEAKTREATYDVTLHISGTPRDLSTSLTSDPPLPEPEIVSLLLTGRTLEEFRGQEFEVAKEQVLSLLAGSVGATLSRGAQQTLGLSEVRIEPNLISPEADPGARLTIGQDITPDMRLIYSMNLADSQDQIWVAEYDATKRFRVRGIKQEDNTYRTEFRHDLRFGGPPEAGQMTSTKPREKKEVGTIEFLGNPIFSEERLANKLKLKTGDKYDFFKLQKGRDRLEDFYAKEGRLEARVRVDREQQDHTIDLRFNITAGPKVEFIFEGWKVSGDVKGKVKKLWEEGIFDAQRAEDALRVIRDPLVEDGYLQARIDYEIQSPTEDLKRVIFTIDPGVHYSSVKLVFEGTSAIEPDELEKQLKEAKLIARVYTDPSKVVDRLTRFYQQQGYLDAKIQLPRYELDPPSRSGQVIIPAQEGPLFKIGEVTFNGNSAFPNAKLQDVAGFSSGQSYEPDLLDRSLSRIEDLYRSNGYADVVINFTRKQESDTGLMDVSFQIKENRRSIVQEVKIEGNDQTSERFVRQRLRINPGDPLDYNKINRSRKNLYDAGVYSLVDFEVQSAEDTAASTEDQKKKLVHILLKLKEVKPYQIRYGAFFDTDRGPGISADISDRNFLGNARNLGTSLRYDGKLKEARGYFNQPFLGLYRIKSTGYAFLRREIEPAFITDRIGFTFQQEAQLREKFIFTYGYTYERVHTYDRNPNPDFPFDITVPIARLTGTLTREKRDDLLDATKGSFLSQALEFAPGQLASEVRFIRYFGQYFKYFPLSEPSPVPFSRGLLRPRLVFASGIRLGLVKGLEGQEVIPSERFFAGGGTTIRGFKQDTVGPVGPLGNPTGGEAVFILNNEIRFPMFSIFDGVGFLDMGNVYSKIRCPSSEGNLGENITRCTSFNPFNVRKSAGFGVRFRTPFFLFRLDYGIKLDRKPGESFGALFFSIGQAF